jgi:hypothetical protein
MPELTTAYSIVTFDEKERDRWRACIEACEGLNPEVVPELVDGLNELVNYSQHANDEGFCEAVEQSDGLKAAIEKARELLARVRA